jgi:hypothetical protein
MMLSNIPSDTTMSDFPENHSPGNWRPIIRETDSYSSSDSSSSENVVSPKGAKFKEERTYSKGLKVSRNVSPTFGFDAKWSTRFLDRELYVKDLPGWCRNHGKGGVYAHDTVRPAIRKKIPTQCQGLYAAAQKLGKTVYLCDSHVQDPSLVRIICVMHFPVETDNPVRPSCLNAKGEFENPSLRAMADIYIGCMIAHGCDPGVAKNLFYSSFGVVDALPLMGPHDWHSKKAAYIAPNDYDTAMSQMAEASSEMLEALPSIFPNFQGYFLFGEAHDFFRKYMGKSKHPVLNTERVVHPSLIECKWWDTDHQKVAVRQTCQALSAATGLDFCHSNIENFNDVMPVSAGMKRKSEERLNAAIHREEEELKKAARSEERIAAAELVAERLLDGAIRREDRAITAEEEQRLLDAAIAAASESVKAAKEERLNAAVRRLEEEEVVKAANEERLNAAIAAALAAAAAKRKDELPAAKRKEIMEATVAEAAAAARRKERLCSHVGCLRKVTAKGVCNRHGPRCSHEGCKKDVVCRGVCRGHDNLADNIRRNIFEG